MTDFVKSKSPIPARADNEPSTSASDITECDA
jgi:hypothetical protein